MAYWRLGISVSVAAILCANLCPWQNVGWLLLLAFTLLASSGCKAWLGYACCFVIALFYSYGHQWQYQRTQLPASLLNQELIIEGVVAQIPEGDAHLLRLLLAEVVTLGAESHRLGRLRLNLYRPQASFTVGQRLQAKVKLRPLQPARNPGGFSSHDWGYQQDLQATGYIKQILKHSPPSPGWRQQLDQAWQQHLQPLASAGVIRALTLGLRDGLSPEVQQLLRETGTAHLLAISGLHVGLVAASVYALVLLLGGLLGTRTGHYNRLPYALGAAMLAALAYATLAGWSLPTQRATLMVWVWGVCRFCHRRVSSVDVLLFAALILLLWHPGMVVNGGFLLSFCAVALLLWGLGGRLGAWGWQSWWRPQWVIWWGMWPLWLLLGLATSPWSFVANLLAIPLLACWILPLSLLALLTLGVLPSVSYVLALLADVAIQGLLWGLAWLPVTESHVAWWPMSGWLLGVAVVVALLGLLPLPRFMRLCWLGLAVTLLTAQPDRPQPGEVWLDVLDVGQGLAVLAQTREHRLLYDTGPAWSRWDAGERVVLPFLRHQGIATLDRIMLSHGDNDHKGGLASLRQRLQTSIIQANDLADAHLPCVAGQSWQWDGVRFEVLHPQQPGRWRRSNNRSCVLLISVGSQRILLPGDIEAEVEAQLVSQVLPNVLLLLAPHHGSRSSSTMEWVKALQPEHVVYSVGQNNRWGFPHPEVRARYAALDAQEYSTSQQGWLRFCINQAGLCPAE